MSLRLLEPERLGSSERELTPARIVLADGESLLRTALARLLPMEGAIEVVAEVADGRRAVEVTVRERPDVLVIDVEMPGIDGLEAVSAILRARPHQAVLVLARHAGPATLRRALRAGVRGVVSKSSDVDQIASAIRLLRDGRCWMDPEASARAIVDDSPLTDRELDVLLLTSEARSVSDIAAALCLAEGTVRNYLSSSIRKTQTRSRHEAARVARTNGWL
ncbi:response regulator transcription factor [Nocardioides lijunqiniae]|uniref:response regulator transcription factor n=1 Tax=Nocardioides lijunqiniae TaxID=2760832 RepID=UPI001877F933|nr:response regulator transcription factor [Nocardioides lijunqiniae]